MIFGERQVEIPWLLKNLKPGSVLDIGSRNSQYIKDLITQGRKIVRVDRLPLEKSYFTINLQADIRKIKPDDIGTFDNVILLSTLEHIGLEAYGFKADWEQTPFLEQLNTFKHCLNFCNNDGILLLTVPFGKFVSIGWQLIYNKQMINELKSQALVVKENYFTLKGDNYVECKQEDCPLLDYNWVNGKGRAFSVACLVFRKE